MPPSHRRNQTTLRRRSSNTDAQANVRVAPCQSPLLPVISKSQRTRSGDASVCNPSSHSSSASRALLPLPTQHNLQVSRTSRRHLTHFFLAGFRRAEGSFGAEEEDAAAAATALGWALTAAADVFAVTDVEDEFVAFGPSNAFEPVDTADFCKEVTITSYANLIWRGLIFLPLPRFQIISGVRTLPWD